MFTAAICFYEHKKEKGKNVQFKIHTAVNLKQKLLSPKLTAFFKCDFHHFFLQYETNILRTYFSITEVN